MFLLVKYIAEKLGPKETEAAAAATGTDGTKPTSNSLSSPTTEVKSESCTDTITNIVQALWNWSVIICMSILPSQMPFDLLYLAMAISLALALIVLTVEGYKYKQGLIKVYPKHIDVMLPVINLILMAWLLISPPPGDWKRLLWFSAIINGSFFCFAIFSLIIKVPFTMQYAMEKVPEELWGKPSFVLINTHITIVWAVMWGISTAYAVVVSLTVPYSLLDSSSSTIYLMNEIIPLALLFAALKFTTWYPGYMRGKFAARQQQEERMDVALVHTDSEYSNNNDAV